MKVSTFFSLLASVVSIGATVGNSDSEVRRQLQPQSVSREHIGDHETNANRLARGLPPNPPAILGTRTFRARPGTPSNTPQCTPLGGPCADSNTCCSQACVVLPSTSFCVCQVNSNCAAGEVCTNNACGPPVLPQDCVLDSDCSAGDVCISGVCGLPVEVCNTASECALGVGCVNQMCGLCQANSDCGGNAGGEVCDTGVCGTAAQPPPDACIDSSGCRAGEVCTNGICGPCRADSDCADSAVGGVCINGVCGTIPQPGPDVCRDSSGCQEGELCILGICV